MDNYNNIAVGELFVQFSGTMAGVAFTALVLILTLHRNESETSRKDSAASLFFVAFVVFVYATQMYTVVGTDIESTRRTASSLILADVGILIAFMHLFLGIRYLISDLGLPHSATLAKVLPAIMVPLIGYGYVYGDVARGYPNLLVPAISITGTVMLTVGLVLLIGNHIRLPRSSVPLVNIMGLCFATAAVLMSAFLQLKNSTYGLNEVAIVLLIVILNLIVGLDCLLVFEDLPRARQPNATPPLEDEESRLIVVDDEEDRAVTIPPSPADGGT